MNQVMDSKIELRNMAFVQLKKVCDELVTHLDQKNVRSLIEVVNTVPPDIFACFSDYVLFPVQLHLHRYVTSDSKFETNSLIELIRCLQVVIQKSVVESVDKFVKLNTLLLSLITDNKNLELSTCVSEDLKYEVISCINWLYESLDHDDEMLKNLYDCEKRLMIHSQAVYACTQFAKLERMVKLRTEAMKCLLTIMRVHRIEFIEQNSMKLKWQVAEIITSMFPGIISSCYVILMSSSTLHRDIYISCIRLFCRSLALVFSDDNDDQKNRNITEFERHFSRLISNEKNITKNGQNESITETLRTDTWIASTTQKLSTLVQCLVPLCNNRQPKVKQELVLGVELVLRNCRYIESVQTSLLHILVILSLDTDEDTRTRARETLKYLIEQPYPKGNQVLQNIEESFLYSVESVHSAINSANENMFISQLNLLNGLLQILNLESMLKSSVYLERLISVLVSLVRFDGASVNTFSEQKFQNLSDTYDDDLVSHISWRNMKHLSLTSENVIKNIFTTLSQKANLENLSYYFLDMLEINFEDRKEIVHLINNVILCERLRSHEKRVRLANDILEVYLNMECWMTPIFGTHKNKSLPLALIRNNLLQVCLLTEGIGNMACCLQVDFQPFLIHCLYLIIERAGCANKFLSSIGLMALQKITESCGYSHIIELMNDNIDFIMHKATLMLRHLQPKSNVFDVFCVIIAYSRKHSLAILCDVIETLLESDSIVHNAHCGGFLRVFAMYIRRLRCWFVSTVEDECPLNESDDKLSEMLSKLCIFSESQRQRSQIQEWSACAVRDELVDLEIMFQRTEYDFDDVSDNEVIEPDTEFPPEPPSTEAKFEEPEKKTPDYIRLLITITEKILHVLPHQDRQNKNLTIEILIDSLLVLHHHGEDELLPVVHKIWSPLVNRFEYDKSEALLMRRCFELLCVIAMTAKDFIKTRTLKSIQPIINQFLLDTSKESRLKDKKSVYRMSQRYKLQLTLLRQLGVLAIQLNFQENEIQNILVASTPYLSSKQPLPLQEACINLFTVIECEHRDFVRMYLLSLCTSKSSFIPLDNSGYCSINLKESKEAVAIECQTNVFKLLEDKLPASWSRLDNL